MNHRMFFMVLLALSASLGIVFLLTLMVANRDVIGYCLVAAFVWLLGFGARGIFGGGKLILQEMQPIFLERGYLWPESNPAIDCEAWNRGHLIYFIILHLSFFSFIKRLRYKVYDKCIPLKK